MGFTRVSSNLTAVVAAKLQSFIVHPVGFEPTPPKRTELESVALDHSATDALRLDVVLLYIQPTARFELATFRLRNGCTNHYATLALCIDA